MSITCIREDGVQNGGTGSLVETDGRSFSWKRNALWKVSAIAAASFLLTWAWLSILDYEFMQSDVYEYWLDSLAWRRPFNALPYYHPQHVPGYPLLIAFLNFLTAGKVAPIALLWGVNFCAHIAGALAIYSAVASRVTERIGYLSVLLFVLWPFIGSSFVAYPLADSVALALLAWGATLLLRERINLAAIPLGFAATVHKGTWIFVILLLVAVIIGQRRKIPFAALVIASLPLGVLWLAGMAWNNYAAGWLVSPNLSGNLAPESNMPVLDGILGTTLAGGTKNVLKSLVLWVHVGMLVTLLVSFVRERNASVKWYALAIVCGLLILFGSLNEYVIWGAVRYSKIAALPVGLYLGSHPQVAGFFLRQPWRVAVLVVLLLASQLVFSLHMTRS